MIKLTKNARINKNLSRTIEIASWIKGNFRLKVREIKKQ